MKGTEILIKTMLDLGVTSVFGYPGGAVIDIYDELYKYKDKIEHITTAHEQGATHAADGYARSTGKTGVVIATSGPGVANTVTGIATAYLDSVPIVVISGNVSCALHGKDSFQEVDIVGVTMPIVKHSYSVTDIGDLEQTVREAFFIASEGRPGPVLIDLPKDIQTAQYDYIGTESEFEGTCLNEEADFEEAAKIINNSKRPYIYAGGGVVNSAASELVVALSKKISAPIGLSMMGLTGVPASYELNLGMTGMHGKFASSKTKAESDLILAIGVRFSDRATGDKKLYCKDRKIIHIDIDPAEINKNIAVDLAMCADIKEVLQKLLSKLDTVDRAPWLSQVLKNKNECEIRQGTDKDFNPQNIIELINSHCLPQTVIATDVGQHQMWVSQYYKFEKPRTLLTSGGLGTMGFGLGAAIGACVGRERTKTVLFTGDGSFGMNLNELATVVKEKLPITIVLLNNGVLGMVRQWQTVFYEKRYSQTTLSGQTDFVKLAQAFGLDGYRCTSLAELGEVLDMRFNANEPLLIECKIDMDERVLPMIPPGGSINDIITSSE